MYLASGVLSLCNSLFCNGGETSALLLLGFQEAFDFLRYTNVKVPSFTQFTNWLKNNADHTCFCRSISYSSKLTFFNFCSATVTYATRPCQSCRSINFTTNTGIVDCTSFSKASRIKFSRFAVETVSDVYNQGRISGQREAMMQTCVRLTCARNVAMSALALSSWTAMRATFARRSEASRRAT